jgi:hypothetical protein
MVVVALAGVLAVAAAAVGIAFATSGGSSASDGAVGGTGNCVRQTFPALEAGHVDKLPEGYAYNSIPASSGLHNPTAAIWNFYDRPVPQIHLVHNLEHGGVVVEYGSKVSDATIAQLADWYQQDARGLIVAPLGPELEKEAPALANKVVLTAWSHQMRCTGLDEAAFGGFLDDFRGPQGDNPEKFPLDALQPGST